MNKYDEYPVPAIADLLEKLCPEGVPPISVQGACLVVSSKGLKRSEILQSGTYPVIDQGEEYVSGYTDDSAYVIADVPVIVFGDHSRRIKWIDAPFAPGADGTKVLRPDTTLIQARYFYHALTSVDIPDLGYSRHWSKVKALTIPLPPTDVQKQIVASLDMFTDLGASLNRELALREEQLSHYRRSLIANSVQTNNASFEPVGRIATVGRGKRVVKKDLSATPEPDMFPVFQNSIAPMGYSNDWNVDGGVAFTIIAGSSSGSIGFSDEPFWAADDCLYFEGHDGVDNRYLYNALLAYNHQLFHHVTKASMPRLHRRYVERLEIPLPPLDVQEQIVDTLDMFTDYTDNLRREINLRRQQLEYYREQLLTFPVAE